MKNLSAGARIGLTVLAVYVLTFIFVLAIMKWPAYILLLALVIVTVVLYVVFYKEMLAVRGNIAYIRGEQEKAKRLLRLSIDKNVASPAAHYNYANLVLRDGDAETALTCLRKTRTLKPDPMMEKNIHMTLGTCYWVNGEINKAIETLEQMRKDYEYLNENVLTTLGYMYIVQGDLDTAQELTDKAIDEAPEYAAAWDNRGQIFYLRKDFVQAKESFEKALAYKPTLVDSLYFMGLIYEAEGDREAARDYYLRANEAPISALNTVKKDELEKKAQAFA